jgi:hypothetical protein
MLEKKGSDSLPKFLFPKIIDIPALFARAVFYFYVKICFKIFHKNDANLTGKNIYSTFLEKINRYYLPKSENVVKKH